MEGGKGDNFRNFTNIKLHLTYYQNGNTRAELLSEEKVLCVLSTEINYVLPKGVILIKDTRYTGELLKVLKKHMKIYYSKTVNNKTYHVCIFKDELYNGYNIRKEYANY